MFSLQKQTIFPFFSIHFHCLHGEWWMDKVFELAKWDSQRSRRRGVETILVDQFHSSGVVFYYSRVCVFVQGFDQRAWQARLKWSAIFLKTTATTTTTIHNSANKSEWTKGQQIGPEWPADWLFGRFGLVSLFYRFHSIQFLTFICLLALNCNYVLPFPSIVDNDEIDVREYRDFPSQRKGR